jgi:hypothetical protein
VLSDNGKQFTGRFTRPFPAEVLFERVCRENGISQRLTKRRYLASVSRSMTSAACRQVSSTPT